MQTIRFADGKKLAINYIQDTGVNYITINAPLTASSLDNPKDRRRTYDGSLWKLLQDHDKQESWYPGAAPTLWVQLDADQHAGTQEDPIPVPISVTASGFEYEVGKYYTWAGQTYLCQRDGMESGTKIILYYPPSDLVGHYFAAA